MRLDFSGVLIPYPIRQNSVIPARSGGISIRLVTPMCNYGRVTSVDSGAGLSEIPAAERGYDE